jgi:hypothetical protein
MGLRGINLKSTIISYGLLHLLYNALMNHSGNDIARDDFQNNPWPKVSKPELFIYVKLADRKHGEK